MENQSTRFARMLEHHILETARKYFNGDQLVEPTLKALHHVIRDRIDRLFAASSYKLTPEARSWLTDQLFKAIRLQHDELVGEYVIMNEYRLDQLTAFDVELLHRLFKDTPTMGQPLEEEIQRRSQL